MEPVIAETGFGMKLFSTALIIVLSITPLLAQAQVTNFETPGNLEPTRNPGCIAIGDADNQLTPADIALGARDCIVNGEAMRGFELIVLMGLRGACDARRVEDRSAHQATAVLQMQLFDSLNVLQKNALTRAQESFGGNGSEKHVAFFQAMRAAGPPDYHPDYMIQHGMGAFGEGSGNGLVEGFDPDETWADLLETYMKCT